MANFTFVFACKGLAHTVIHEASEFSYKPKINEPIGGQVFYNFDSAALDALKQKEFLINDHNIDFGSNDIVSKLTYLEAYNALGYYL